MPVVMLSADSEMIRVQSYPLKMLEYSDRKGETLRKYSNEESGTLAETKSTKKAPSIWFDLHDKLYDHSFAWTEDTHNFYLAYKLASSQNNKHALVGTKINKEQLTTGLQKVINEIEQADFYILNPKGETLIQTPQAPKINEIEQDESLFNHHILVKETLQLNHHTQWQLVLSVPSRNLVTPIERNLQGTLLQTLLVLAGITIIIFIVAYRAGVPVKRLRENANLLVRQRFDEIKKLGTFVSEYRALDESIHALKKQYAAIKRYVPTTLIDQLNQSDTGLEVKGEIKNLTLMNMTIPNFYRLTKGFDADQMVSYLSAYHSVVYEVINDKKGIVDHFEGENIQAYWGAPIETDKDVLNSCHAAMEMKRLLNELNQKLIQEGMPEIPFYCGIYSGEAVVGNFGSVERMVYTAIGESVEESKFVNQHNGQYGTKVIICEQTYQQVKHDFFTRKLDQIYTSKHPEGMNVYELIAWKIDPVVEDLTSFVTEYEQALTYRLENRLDEAEALLMKLADQYPKDEATAYQLGMVYQLKQQQMDI